MIFSSVCAFFATNVPTIYIRAAYHIANPAGHTGANFYWLTNGSAPNAFTAGEGTSFPIIVDGQYHTYAVNLAAESNYTSVITQLRFDPTFNSAVGDYVDVAAISSSPIATQNLILNGDFMANAAAFTTYPGYALPSGTVAITNWVNALGGLVGLNGPATGAAVGNPFSPTNAGLRTFAFIQGGSTVLTQGLPATYTTNATYQFSFDVAARAGNTNVTFRVQIGDNSVVHVGTGNLIANPAGFTHYIYTFTSPATFNGAPSVQLWNLTAGDNTVDFANVSLVLIGSKNLISNGNFMANVSAFTNYPGYASDGSNPASIASWGSAYSGVGLNGAGTGATVGNPFGPSNPGGFTYAFLQGGTNWLFQYPPLTTNTTYKMDFDVAARAGDTVNYEVDVADNIQTYVTATGVGNNAAFSHVTAVFTTPTTFNGSPFIALSNLTPGDNTIDFANISLLQLWTGP